MTILSSSVCRRYAQPFHALRFVDEVMTRLQFMRMKGFTIVPIDFQSGFFKLLSVSPEKVMPSISPMLVEGEQVFAAFVTIRDSVVFTNRRIVAVNAQGITGKKTAYTSLPYSKVQAF